jgi:hypothetical protein
MNDLLWLTNHPVRGNVVGIPTSQNYTPEELESWLSAGIHRISAKLPHSIELELKKPRRTQMDSGRASTLDLLQGLLTSREVLLPSEPHLSLSPLYKEWIWEHYRKLNLTFSTLSAGGSTGVFRAIKSMPWPKLGLGMPSCQAGRPTWVVGQPSFVAALPFPLWIPFLSTYLDTWWKRILKARQTLAGRPRGWGWPAPHWLRWARALCYVIPLCHIVCDYPWFWT